MPDLGRQETGSQGSPSPRRLSAWYVVAPAAALVVGLVLGGVLVWAAGGGGDLRGPAADEQTPSATPTPSTSAPATALVVPDACLETADTLERAITTIEQGVGAIRDFRAERVIGLLDELEDLDGLAREQVASCREADVSDTPLPSEAASSGPTPTSTEPTTEVPTEQVTPGPTPSASAS